ncbi:putative transcription factor MYB/SANT family [Medicago truncatula]|uniref:Putative transcription factor MYB/SANT family n=1 Tax=Medicago truncatula TaxID=3880 RepID=G7KH84_MEDTR|nr:SWI/SNF complex subunit SWI3B [Medicago truncatula]AES99827.1 SWI/SNF complex subunit SWI3B-like protein [Medicago truncatula]RHN57300.1 putative transcription factor MYB/SANT family [Medicago truncatula]
MASSTPNITVEPPSSAIETPQPITSSDANLILVPSHSRWFSWDSIHECEIRNIPESSKNPRVYKYYRNSIVKFFRFNPNRKITFTDVRKIIVGDVGSIRRVFDFLEAWGLINYHPSSSLSKPLKWEDKDAKSDAASNSTESPSLVPANEAKRICSVCMDCFACDKNNRKLCARCFIRGNYRIGMSNTKFKRVEISEETKNEWTEEETLNLLEAITNFGDDWKRVSHQVVGRTDKECVARFLELPFGDQLKPPVDAEWESEIVGSGKSSKRMCLTPLNDAINPIMAQAAFLSALAGTEVAQAAAQAALTSLSIVYKSTRINYRSFPRNTLQQDASVASDGGNASDSIQGSLLRANLQLEKEESDVEKDIYEVIDVQMKNIQDKLINFEDLDVLMEKERQQLEQTKSLFFLDQLNLLFRKTSAPTTGEGNHVKSN